MKSLVPLVLFTLILFMPAQEATTSVSALTVLSISDDRVQVGSEVTVCVFVNVTVLFNDTIAEYRNGTISVNVTMRIPEGLNYTRSSYGSYKNGTFSAYEENSTEMLVYMKLYAAEEGEYTLTATVTINASITARNDNATPAYYNDTITVSTNTVKLTVYKEQEAEEEWNRISVYDALRERYLQIIIVLLLAGFILANFIADQRARKRSKEAK